MKSLSVKLLCLWLSLSLVLIPSQMAFAQMPGGPPKDISQEELDSFNLRLEKLKESDHEITETEAWNFVSEILPDKNKWLVETVTDDPEMIKMFSKEYENLYSLFSGNEELKALVLDGIKGVNDANAAREMKGEKPFNWFLPAVGVVGLAALGFYLTHYKYFRVGIKLRTISAQIKAQELEELKAKQARKKEKLAAEQAYTRRIEELSQKDKAAYEEALRSLTRSVELDEQIEELKHQIKNLKLINAEENATEIQRLKVLVDAHKAEKKALAKFAKYLQTLDGAGGKGAEAAITALLFFAGGVYTQATAASTSNQNYLKFAEIKNPLMRGVAEIQQRIPVDLFINKNYTLQEKMPFFYTLFLINYIFEKKFPDFFADYLNGCINSEFMVQNFNPLTYLYVQSMILRNQTIKRDFFKSARRAVNSIGNISKKYGTCGCN